MQPKNSGSWTIVDPQIIKRAKHKYVLCRCDCGHETLVDVFRLAHDILTSRCRKCYAREQQGRKSHSFKHGKTGSIIYKIWAGIITRCYNPKVKIYKYYGGRGITVCDRWRDFQNFYEDMGDRPYGLQIDRIDNDKGYSPDNCRWATSKQNNPWNKGSIPDDMPGKKVGRLSILRRTFHKPGHKYYLCRCECGSELIRSGGELRRGKTKQCTPCHYISKKGWNERRKKRLNEAQSGNSYQTE